MKIEQSTIDLISEFEGCVLHPYTDEGGVWTIGYGFTTLNGVPVTSKTGSITLAEADQILTAKLQHYGQAVLTAVHVPMTQNQFDACTSLCYNIGTGGFAESTVARMINAKNIPAASNAFLLWDKVGDQVSAKLLARRQAERKLFLS